MFVTSLTVLQAQPWAGLIDPARAIDWTAVGIPGHIPVNRTQCGTTIASPGAATDATSLIQTALNACAAGQFVLLGPGTFRIAKSVSVPSNVTLRGSGPANTILDLRGSGAGAVSLGSGDIGSASVNVTGGASGGSTRITVANASGMSVGTYLHITELNDSTFVTINGDQGACTWCDGYWSGTRTRGQIVEITAISGTTVDFTPALYTAYPQSPQVVPFTATKNAGVEGLQVYANNTGYSANFLMARCAYCWISNVHSNYADGNHVQVTWGYRNEIRDSYFHDAFSHSSGTTDGDINLAFKTSGTLVENNILERLHASIMMEWGAAGNVISYNYMFGNFDVSAPNVLIANIDFHGAHPQFNLSEGNVGSEYYADNIWGSNGKNTAFRNWMSGTTQICNPLTGRAAVNCTGSNGHLAFQANRPFQIAALTLNDNILGNVAGSAQLAAQMPESAMVVSPQNRAYSGTAYDFTFGYGGLSDAAGVCASGTPCPTYATAIVHGNYTNATNSIVWSPSISNRTLPASLYLASAPAWWSSSIPWPAIGPDVTGGAGPGGHAYSIPAQLCYNNNPKDSNGALVFDAATCYTPSVAPSAPVAPSALTATAK